MEKTELKLFQGTPLTFITPSGVSVTIREQSGEDDAILSRISSREQAEVINNMNTFVASIVTENGYNNKSYLTLDEAENLKLKDKHYIILKSRLHSIGSELEFDYTCQEESCNETFGVVEDLEQYDQDLDNPGKAEDLFKHVITPYPNGSSSTVEITLSSNRKIRFEYLTGKGEKYILNAFKKDNFSANTEVFARKLSIEDNGQWVELSSLNIFSKKETTEIRKAIKENDKQFNGGVEVKCPHCRTEAFLPF